MLPFLARLKERKLAHWCVAYLAAVWLLLQVLGLLVQAFDWSPLVLRTATVLLSTGVLAMLVIAWYHGEKGKQRVSGVELLMLAGILVIAGAAVAFVGGSPGQRRTRVPISKVVVSPPERIPEQSSIAVLPFTNTSSDPEQEYFSDGLSDEISGALARVPGLRVAARISAYSFKGRHVPVDSIGRVLHVGYVLEGSVRKVGERVRIMAQLTSARDGYQVWSERYDRDLTDVYAVQDEISRAIVSHLRLELSDDYSAAPLVRLETRDPEAHALLLRAYALGRVGDVPNWKEAVRLLRQALQRDSSFARARAELANGLHWLAFFGHIPREAGYGEARAAARTALALDSTTAEAYVALAQIAEWHEWNWAEAERQYRRALDLNANDARAHASLAWLLMRLKRTGESLAEAQRAVELDPLSPSLRNHLAAMYCYAGRLDDALGAYRDALALSPHSSTFLGNAAMVHALAGRHRAALDMARQARAIGGHKAWTIGVLGYVAARAGDVDAAEAALRDLDALGGGQGAQAMIEGALGRTDRAFALLEAAIARRDTYVVDLSVDPAWDMLRGDPRMGALLRKAGLPQ